MIKQKEKKRRESFAEKELCPKPVGEGPTGSKAS